MFACYINKLHKYDMHNGFDVHVVHIIQKATLFAPVQILS